jgi:hypothetical protein
MIDELYTQYLAFLTQYPLVATGIQIVLPLLAAGLLALAAYSLLSPLGDLLARRGTAGRLDAFAQAGNERQSAERARFGGDEHRLRVAFAAIGLQAAGAELLFLWGARIAAGVGLFFGLQILGLPMMTALVGLPAGYIVVNGYIAQKWNAVRSEVEAEIPALLNNMATTLQTTDNVISATRMVRDTLKGGGPLQLWLDDVVRAMEGEGIGGLEEVSKSAAAYSHSLSIVVELIRRMWQTGGQGYAKAFVAASENLETVLDARVSARSTGDAGRGVMWILVGATIGMMAIVSRNEGMAEIVQSPIVQILYAAIMLLVVFGQTQITKMIDEAV